MSAKIKIGILGCAGRMGRTIYDVLENHPHAQAMGGSIKGELEMALSPFSADKTFLNPADLMNISDVVIDFTLPQAFDVNLTAAVDTKTPIVIGTTGLNDTQLAAIDIAAKTIPVLQSSNMSLGVNVLASLVEKTAAILSAEEFDIDILEMHHNKKVDAPSGTALLLGEAAAKGRDVPLTDVKQAVRDGQTGARPVGEIGFVTLRGGDIAGDHSVIYAGDGQMLTLSHRATSRRVFASGAVFYALKISGQKPGRYTTEIQF